MTRRFCDSRIVSTRNRKAFTAEKVVIEKHYSHGSGRGEC